MGVHHLYGLRINCWLQSRKLVSILTYLDNAAETNKVLGKTAAVWDHKETRSRLETNRRSPRTMSGYQRLQAWNGLFVKLGSRPTLAHSYPS